MMLNRSRIAVIGAHTIDNAYGLGQGMPWPRGSLNKDMLARFKPITSEAPEGKKNLLLAGRITLETFGARTLANRILMGISSKAMRVYEDGTGHMIAPSIEEALSFAEDTPSIHHVFFIGGKEIWKEGLKHAGKAYFTLVHKTVEDSKGLARLAIPLHEQAIMSGLALSDKEAVTDFWDGDVEIDFLDYARP